MFCAKIWASNFPSYFKSSFGLLILRVLYNVLVLPSSCLLLLPMLFKLRPSPLLSIVFYFIHFPQLLTTNHKSFFFSIGSINIISSKGSHLMTKKTLMVFVSPFQSTNSLATRTFLITHINTDLSSKEKELIFSKLVCLF